MRHFGTKTTLSRSHFEDDSSPHNSGSGSLIRIDLTFLLFKHVILMWIDYLETWLHSDNMSCYYTFTIKLFTTVNGTGLKLGLNSNWDSTLMTWDFKKAYQAKCSRQQEYGRRSFRQHDVLSIYHFAKSFSQCFSSKDLYYKTIYFCNCCSIVISWNVCHYHLCPP